MAIYSTEGEIGIHRIIMQSTCLHHEKYSCLPRQIMTISSRRTAQAMLDYNSTYN